MRVLGSLGSLQAGADRVSATCRKQQLPCKWHCIRECRAAKQRAAAGGKCASCSAATSQHWFQRARRRVFRLPAVILDVPQQVPVLVLRQRPTNMQRDDPVRNR